MKKVIYYGLAKDFWWKTRFEEFMDKLGYTERLSEKFSLVTLAGVWYSNLHNVAVRYNLENTIYPQEGRHIQRSRVILFGYEDDITALEEIIRSESEKFRGIDTIK